MHHISWLRLQNFRSCKDIELDLWSYTPLVGHNNVGKSNIIRGLSWLLNKSGLNEADFFDTTKPVVATGRIEGITEDILDNLEAKHRKRIEEYVDVGTLWIRQEQETTTTKGTQLEVSLLTPGNDPADKDAWVKNPTGITPAIKALFPEPIHIEAMADAAEDSGKFKAGSTIGKLLGAIQGAVQAARETELKKAVDDLKEILSAEGANRPEELTEIDEAATRILQGYFPDLTLRTHIPAPSLDVMFKGGTIQIKDRALPVWRGIDSLGHGALRSVQMSLVQCLAERNRDGGGSSACTLLLVDEPELYLHPQAIEQARGGLKQLAEGGYQVIFSTHSPMFVEPDDVPKTHVIIKGDDGGTTSRPTFKQAYEKAVQKGPTQTEILFSLDHASQILFCERALVVEGPTEKRLLPLLYKVHHGRDMARDRLALVNVEGKDSIPKTRAILAAMSIEAKALADLDAAFSKEHFCSSTDQDRTACQAVLDRLELDNGAPGCRAMCQDPSITGNIDSLHNTIKADGIWIWKGGTIEDHLGLKSKKPAEHDRMRNDLLAKGMAALADQAAVEAFLDWLV